jgi:hypothetical protein
VRLFLIPLLIVACGPKNADDTAVRDDDTPGGTDDAECADDDDCASDEICADDACELGDRDNSPDEAASLFWSEPVEGQIAPAGDEDWYAVTSDGREYLVANTTDAEDDEVLDTVVSVYDTNGSLLAWEDEHPGGNIGSGYDSIVYAWLAEAGTYYVKVEDIGHFDGGNGLGGDEADYVLTVDSYDEPNETDSLQSASRDLGETSADTWYPTLAVLEEVGDVDYFAFDVPSEGMPLGIVAAQHSEGSDTTPRVRLYNGDGDLVLSFDDPDVDDAYAWLPFTRSTRYVLAVDDAAGLGGADHWAPTLFILRDTDRAYPDEVEPDDTIETATTVDFSDQEPDAGQWVTAAVQGWLETVDDADVFHAVNPVDGGYISVVTFGPSWGGQMTPRVEVLNDAGETVGGADGVAGEDTWALNVGPIPVGSYYVRITSQPDTGAAGGEGDYYMALVHFTDFEFDE